jgi:hypothetical protein
MPNARAASATVIRTRRLSCDSSDTKLLSPLTSTVPNLDHCLISTKLLF